MCAAILLYVRVGAMPRSWRAKIVPRDARIAVYQGFANGAHRITCRPAAWEGGLEPPLPSSMSGLEARSAERRRAPGGAAIGRIQQGTRREGAASDHMWLDSPPRRATRGALRTAHFVGLLPVRVRHYSIDGMTDCYLESVRFQHEDHDVLTRVHVDLVMPGGAAEGDERDALLAELCEALHRHLLPQDKGSRGGPLP